MHGDPSLKIYTASISPAGLLCAGVVADGNLPFFISFFSSRRRHTPSNRDWSSDVCSSDLVEIGYGLAAPYRQGYGSEAVATGGEAASKIGPGTTDRNQSGHARLDGGQPGRGLAAAPSCSAMVETGRRRLRRGCGRPRLRAAPSASARVQG